VKLQCLTEKGKNFWFKLSGAKKKMRVQEIGKPLTITQAGGLFQSIVTAVFEYTSFGIEL